MLGCGLRKRQCQFGLHTLTGRSLEIRTSIFLLAPHLLAGEGRGGVAQPRDKAGMCNPLPTSSCMQRARRLAHLYVLTVEALPIRCAIIWTSLPLSCKRRPNTFVVLPDRHQSLPD